MPEYLLFVDTETTGLPARWDRPYAEEWEWPCIAQVAWVVFTAAGELVKADQDYLQIPAGRMPAAAVAVHGLTPEFLQAHGQEPAAVLRRLLQDLATYRPRVVGHFLPLDFHVLGAAFARAGLANALPALPQFCTMQLTRLPLQGVTAPPRRPLRLHQLHERLFGQPLEREHDAHIDAAATARCFFELQRRGLLPGSVLAGQAHLALPGTRPQPRPWRRVALLATAAVLFCYLLYRLTNG